MPFPIKVALLDTGINAQHKALKDNIHQSYEYINEEWVHAKTSNNDVNGHGTKCASVILKESPGANICSLKVFDESGFSSAQILESALQFLLDSDAQIINISLSIIDRIDRSDLKKLLKEMGRRHKIVVASLQNYAKRSIPASIKECIGVQGFILDHNNDMWFNKCKNIQCVIDSTPYLHCDYNGSYSFFGKSNSYAAANLSGKIARILNENDVSDNNQIYEILAKKASKNFWTGFDLRKSRRFPNLHEFDDLMDEELIKELDDCIKHFLKLSYSFDLRDQFLFSEEVGLTFESCFDLIRKIEQEYGYIFTDYTKISRECFYTVQHLANLIKTQSIKRQ